MCTSICLVTRTDHRLIEIIYSLLLRVSPFICRFLRLYELEHEPRPRDHCTRKVKTATSVAGLLKGYFEYLTQFSDDRLVLLMVFPVDLSYSPSSV